MYNYVYLMKLYNVGTSFLVGTYADLRIHIGIILELFAPSSSIPSF